MHRIFGMDEARNFKFGTRIELGMSHLIDDKILSKGAWSGSSGQTLNFKPPSVILEWVKLETSNLVYGQIFASPISRVTKYLKRGMVRVQVEFLNFKTPYLNFERVKLETLNLIYG